ncbi:phosphoribosylanthranilate isomerase [Flocculibacter collagenilyticus]|uniref:phosphoribosylanthranilate isomerase n=1 Tax=Flocculibacter collagenilyticus TaxID=2744479 RepID=UPI0018F2ADC1|nr:phosphoribosylanthranilate isomerase [Flocculibacter collagenilyticus]
MEKLIQVAGIIDENEAKLIADEGVQWLGFPLRLPSGKDDISEPAAKKIIESLSAPQAGVLISYMVKADEISQFCTELGFTAVQLHGDVEVAELRKLKQMRPDLYVLKSLVVKEDNADELLTLVDECAEYVDMFITDTFDPKTGAKGATGLTHNWDVSAELVRRSPKPLMMAGGLNPDNVADAIRKVKPAAVDAHTGLEGPDGRKDRNKVKKFFAEANKAFAEIEGA